QMRPLLAFALFGLVSLAGCQKVAPLEIAKTVELRAAEVSPTPTVLPAMNAVRTVTVDMRCDTACDAYLIIGPTEAAMARLNNAQDPKAEPFHSKIGGKGGDVTFDLEANKELPIALRNPGMKPIKAEVKLTPKAK